MVTLKTFADAVAARPEPAWPLIMDANCEPSSSRLTRLATGVELAKNAVQLAAIAAVPAPDDEVVALGVAAGVVAGVVAGAAVGVGVEAGGVLLLHAVAMTASAHTPRIAGICLLVFIQLFSNCLSAGSIPPPADLLSGLPIFFPEPVRFASNQAGQRERRETCDAASVSDLQALRDRMREFTADRQWSKYHDPKSVLLALVGEVGELAELFQWLPADAARDLARTEPLRTRVGEELSDVLLYLVLLADVLGVDLAEAANAKLTDATFRYPPGAGPDRT